MQDISVETYMDKNKYSSPIFFRQSNLFYFYFVFFFPFLISFENENLDRLCLALDNVIFFPGA